MAFLHKTIVVTILVVLTLCLQCAGMAALIHWARSRFALGLYRLGPWRSGMLIVRFTSIIIVLHGLQILLWAWFYRRKCFPSWESALYFSGGSYSTVGTGDLLLPRTWRLLGVVESGTGALMGGISAGIDSRRMGASRLRTHRKRREGPPVTSQLPTSLRTRTAEDRWSTEVD
jgi:hypothetical protein